MEMKNLYIARLLFFSAKYQYTNEYINILMNKYINKQTYEFRVCSPSLIEGKDGRLYIQRHILQLQVTMHYITHPPRPGITSAVV